MYMFKYIYYLSHILSVFIKHLNEFRKQNMYHVYDIYIYIRHDIL